MTSIQPDVPSPAEPEPAGPVALVGTGLSRRGFLRAAGVAGLAGVAAGVAACTNTAAPIWSFGPPASLAAVPSLAPSAAPSADPSADPSGAPSAAPSEAPASPSASPDPNLPPGWTDHDIAAREVVRRFVGNLAPTLATVYGDEVFGKIADMLGADDTWPDPDVKPSFAQVPQLVPSSVLEDHHLGG